MTTANKSDKDRVIIFDTTLRDGEQCPGATMTFEEKLEVAEMLDDMGTGLVVERLLGAGQSNILGGEFNGNVLLGYKVEGGRVCGRVKNTVISGNVYIVLRDIQAIEKDSHWVGGSLRTPALYLENVSVATKESA